MLVSSNAGVLGKVQKGVTAAADALDGLWVGICQLREGFSQLLLIYGPLQLLILDGAI